MQQKIVPSLWITAPAEEVADYYKRIFGNEATVTSSDALEDTPSGDMRLFTMILKGQMFRVMCTGKHDEFTDAVSFELVCKDQAEIDYFWDAFTKEGVASKCGWCRDKYGVRWQVIPENMGELMSKPDAFDTMLRQTKIVISEY